MHLNVWCRWYSNESNVLNIKIFKIESILWTLKQGTESLKWGNFTYFIEFGVPLLGTIFGQVAKKELNICSALHKLHNF